MNKAKLFNGRTPSELETLIRFDDEVDELVIWTGSPAVARFLQKKGYSMVELSPKSWQCKAPNEALRLWDLKEGVAIIPKWGREFRIVKKPAKK